MDWALERTLHILHLNTFYKWTLAQLYTREKKAECTKFLWKQPLQATENQHKTKHPRTLVLGSVTQITVLPEKNEMLDKCINDVKDLFSFKL